MLPGEILPKITREALTSNLIMLAKNAVINLRYADDTVIIADTSEALQRIME